MNQQVATVKQGGLMERVAQRFGVEAAGLTETLKATAFKGQVTDAQMQALLIVADQHGLNPWTKEIYAFPDNGGIVPVVGVDGWSRIINSHSQFDGMDFEQDSESCTCIIYRKDRNHPIKVTEWHAECARNSKPWNSHPRRMLRHKAMIQCARLAFGFTGIYDQDEAEVILEKDVTPKSENQPDASGVLAKIESAQSHDELKQVFGEAWNTHQHARADLKRVYDERKKALEEFEQAEKSEPIDTEWEEVSNDDAPGI